MAALPTGTVTYLFTDVEGSVGLWEAAPSETRLALARHDALVERQVVAHGGALVRPRGEGDSRFAVFSRPTDALATALSLQRALAAEPWPTPTPIKVRMALHTGEADLREGDYYGPPVNRCARLRASAHGGQVLVSSAVEELVRDCLPEDLQLRCLGEVRLRDLARAERVYQLCHPDLSADFPPLQSLEAYPNNLPLQLTSFVGREREMAEVKNLLGRARLLTLTGTGGAGKTRLALQVAAELLEEYSGGVYLVALSTLSSPNPAAQAVASALGLREVSGQPMMTTLADCLRPRRLLLVLDNCEHLIESAAALTDSLLRSCPNLKVLATSREALAVPGEVLWHVPSLTLPDPDHLPPPERLLEYEAIRLFVERGRAARADFALTDRNAPAVVGICARLDGLPLAIELAAARVGVLSAEQLAKRLDDRLSLLSRGSRTAEPRQQTLRAAIDWSYDLLNEAERVLLRRLAVFADGWTLESAEAVCADDLLAGEDVLDLLSKLVERSLVLVEARGAEARYRLLETIREYGQEKLLASGEAERIGRAHAEHNLGLAGQAAAGLRGPRQREWLDRLEMEQDNLRASLYWWLRAGEAERGLQMAHDLFLLWFYRGPFGEATMHLKCLLDLPGAREVAVAPAALAELATFTLLTERGEAAHSILEEALRLARARGDRWAAARALMQIGLVGDGIENPRQAVAGARAIFRDLDDPLYAAWCDWYLGVFATRAGDFRGALSCFTAGLDTARELVNCAWTGAFLSSLAEIACRRGDLTESWRLAEESEHCLEAGGFESQLLLAGDVKIRLLRLHGDYEAARQLAEEALERGKRLGGLSQMVAAEGELGLIAAATGDYGAAEEHLFRTLATHRQRNVPHDVSEALASLGAVARARGDLGEARQLLTDSLAISRQQGFTFSTALALGDLGCIAMAEGNLDEARGLLAESLALRREMGDRIGITACLASLGGLAVLEGQGGRALRLLAAAARLRDEVGYVPHAAYRLERDTWLRMARESVGYEPPTPGEGQLTLEEAKDQAMALDEAVEYALAERD